MYMHFIFVFIMELAMWVRVRKLFPDPVDCCLLEHFSIFIINSLIREDIPSPSYLERRELKIMSLPLKILISVLWKEMC